MQGVAKEYAGRKIGTGKGRLEVFCVVEKDSLMGTVR
jgi:hypothetical protein